MMKLKRTAILTALSIMCLSTINTNVFASDIVTLKYKCGDIENVEKREIRRGVLPNGLKYTVVPMTDEEIEALNSNVSLYSYSWTGNVTVPIANTSGTNGAQLGKDFIIFPDNTAVISVGNLPTTTMPTVNIGAAATNGMWNDWIPSVEGYSKVYFEPGEGYTGYSYKVTVSTSEAYSKTARFSIVTE